MSSENKSDEVVAWALIPYESAFTRDWYLGGLGDLRLPVVLTKVEAIFAGMVLMLCGALLMVGMDPWIVALLAPMSLYGPRFVRDRAFDGKNVLEFAASAARYRLRTKTYMPDGTRRAQVDGTQWP